MKPLLLARLGRKARWTVGAVALLAITAVVLLILYMVILGQRLNHAGFARVQVGMTLAEVERLMGGPPGHYGRHDGSWVEPAIQRLEDWVEQVWWDDEYAYKIWFDSDGRTVWKEIRAVH